jgi:hypothetical protein
MRKSQWIKPWPSLHPRAKELDNIHLLIYLLLLLLLLDLPLGSSALTLHFSMTVGAAIPVTSPRQNNTFVPTGSVLRHTSQNIEIFCNVSH